MGFFKSAFSAIQMATTGKVVAQIDTPILDGYCQISLRLKRTGSDDAYVVLAGIAEGNWQYYPMNADEFTQFADAVQAIQNQLSKLNKQ